MENDNQIHCGNNNDNKQYTYRIKQIVEWLFDINDKDLFVAQMLKEKIDYKHDILNITIDDINFANQIYDECYMENNTMCSKWNNLIYSSLRDGQIVNDNDDIY